MFLKMNKFMKDAPNYDNFSYCASVTLMVEKNAFSCVWVIISRFFALCNNVDLENLASASYQFFNLAIKRMQFFHLLCKIIALGRFLN